MKRKFLLLKQVSDILGLRKPACRPYALAGQAGLPVPLIPLVPDKFSAVFPLADGLVKKLLKIFSRKVLSYICLPLINKRKQRKESSVNMQQQFDDYSITIFPAPMICLSLINLKK